MKKTAVLVGALIISVSMLCFDGLGGPGEPQRLRAKEAVSKVLTANSFTPPIVLPGPGSFTWYVGCRSIKPLLAEQVIVGLRGGNDFTVEVTAFRREKPDQPWIQLPKGEFVVIEQNMKERLVKELAAEEKPAKP